MSTLTVGTGEQYATIHAAVAAASDGDVVKVDAGTYVNDFTTVNDKILLQGVGGMVHMVATETPPDGKAIMTTNTDAVVDHFEFSGAAVPDRNGAGMRYQGGNLTLTNDYFHDNQDGLLANSDPNGHISIRASEFAHNGAGDGYSHNIYVGDIASLNIQGSYFHDAIVGHEIKSRAEETVVTDSRLAEGPNGTGSYSIDTPNGGHVILSNNAIEQGPHTGNPAIVAFGEEGNLHANSSLEVFGNTVLNDLGGGRGTMVVNATHTPASVAGNTVYGLTEAQILQGPGSETGNTIVTVEPRFEYGSIFATQSTPPTGPVSSTPTGHSLGTVGTGPDTLVLRVSEDAYLADAQFSVKVDGHPVSGSPFTTSAIHSSGADDTLTVKGNWGTGSHAVEVAFLNDAWGGTPGTDRNLYVDGMTLNGLAVPGGASAFYSPGSHEVVLPPRVAPVETVHSVGTGPDTLTLQVSQDAYLANAQYTVSVDGKRLGGVFTAEALHSAGAHDVLQLHGDWGAGQHTASVAFLNDAWGGTPGTDRNLYVDSMSYDGAAVPGGHAALYSPGSKDFTFSDAGSRTAAPGTTGATNEVPTTGGTPTPAPGAGYDAALLGQFTHNGVVDYAALAASLAAHHDGTGVWFG